VPQVEQVAQIGQVAQEQVLQAFQAVAAQEQALPAFQAEMIVLVQLKIRLLQTLAYHNAPLLLLM
jgi:hypothetical protein